MTERFRVQGVEFKLGDLAIERAMRLAFASTVPVIIEVCTPSGWEELARVDAWRGAEALRQAKALAAREASGESEVFLL